MTITFQSGTVEKIAIGSIKDLDTGNYQISVNGPETDPRIVSVSKGVFQDVFVNMLSGIGLTFLLGIAGFVTLIFAIIAAFGKHTTPPPTNHLSH